MRGEATKVGIPQLTLLLEDLDEQVRVLADIALSQIKQPVRLSRSQLNTRLKDSNGKIRSEAVFELAFIGVSEKIDLPELIPMLKDPDPEVRSNAASSFGDIGVQFGDVKKLTEKTIPILIPMLRDSDAGVRSIVLSKLGYALGELKAADIPQELIPLLIPLLKDPDRTVRSHAARTLGQIGKPAKVAIPYLLPLLQEPPDWYVRIGVAQALGQIGEPTKIVIPELIKLLKDSDSEVRYNAIQGLIGIGEPAKIAIPDIISLFNNPNDPEGDTHYTAFKFLTIVKADAKVLHKAEADMAMVQGSKKFKIGQFEAASESWQQALQLYRDINDQQGEGKALGNLGRTYSAFGKYAQAIESYQGYLKIVNSNNDLSEKITVLGYLGNTYFHLGNYDKAIEFYQEALTIATTLQDLPRKSNALGNLGMSYQALGNTLKAIQYQEKSLEISREINDRMNEANALGNLGIAYETMGNHAKAIEYQKKSLAIRFSINDQQGIGQSLGNLGTAYNSLGDYINAVKNHEKSLEMARKIKDHPGEGQFLTNLGATLLKLNKLPEAELALRSAITIWESFRSNLDDNNKISIGATQARTYLLLQRVLVQQNRSEAALEIAERGRGRAFAELLSSRLTNKTSDEIQQIAKAPNLAEIRNIAKTQNATLVEYSINDEFIYIWVVKPNGTIAFKSSPLKNLAIPLHQLVQDSRRSLGVRSRELSANHSQSEENPEQFRQLHKLLIDPIATELPIDPQQRVIFIPQDELFLVPFAALQNNQGKYLIEDHTISSAPSIQTLELTRQQLKDTQSQTPPLIVGNPTMPIWLGSQLESLPGSEREAIAIGKVFNAPVLTGSQATKSAVLKRINNASMIHFATHGLLDNVIGDLPGAIALAPSSSENGFLTSTEIFDLRLNANLVVLSACDTGRGKITGDGVIGLSRSFVAAGVPSVIVSLWAVNDDSTSFLMSDFYRNFKTNPNKAQAMRNAMLTTMKQYPSPKDWAAFTLIGEAN